MPDLIQTLFPKKSFLRNFSILISTNILVSAIGMFTSIYIARILSPENYGKYGVLLSLVGILQVFSSLGLPTTITREVSRDQDNSSYYFLSSIFAYFFGFTLAVIIYFLFSFFSFASIDSNYHGLVLLSLISVSCWNIIQNVAFGMQRMEHVGIINLIMTVVLLLVYIVTPKDLITIKFVFSVSIVIQIIKDLIFFWSSKKAKLFSGNSIFSFNELMKFSIKLIKASLPFFIMGFFSMLSNQMPIQFLNINSGTEEVAYFNTANKLLLPISMIITTAMTALFPNLAKLYLVDKVNYVCRIQDGFKLLIYFGVFGAVIITLFRFEIVEFVYGEKYINTALVLTYQVWFMIAFAIFNFIGSILSSSDNENLLTYLSILYAIVSVTILWFGSFHGAEYLSLAFLIASFINLTYHWYFMEKSLSWPFSNIYRFKLLGSIIIPIVILFLLPDDISFFNKILISIAFTSSIIIFNLRKIKFLMKTKLNL
ncbi:oligosaccharide flippase family protein [Bacteroidota bacterium]